MNVFTLLKNETQCEFGHDSHSCTDLYQSPDATVFVSVYVHVYSCVTVWEGCRGSEGKSLADIVWEKNAACGICGFARCEYVQVCGQANKQISQIKCSFSLKITWNTASLSVLPSFISCTQFFSFCYCEGSRASLSFLFISTAVQVMCSQTDIFGQFSFCFASWQIVAFLCQQSIYWVLSSSGVFN